MSSFFRYPGGKAKLKKEIIRAIKAQSWEGKPLPLVEVCAGGASIGLEYLKGGRQGDLFAPIDGRLWLNDADRGIEAIWIAVAYNSEALKRRIRAFEPSLDDFRNFRNDLSSRGVIKNPVERAFKKIALHQMSYSGLGLKAGGPIGGENQSSAYGIGCRWNPESICKKIDRISRMLKGVLVRVSHDDFRKVLKDSEGWVAYIDPPYFDKGGDLYHHSFKKKDHEELAMLLRKRRNWVLSYDDHPRIRNLYAWAAIEEVTINYSITAKDNKGREGKELIICAPSNSR
jgi:DNA adenine methylase